MQLAATAAAWLLRAREEALRRQLPYIVALAVGVLLATALLHLLPEAIEQLGNHALTWLLTGAAMIALFAAERLFFVISGTGAEPEIGEPCAEHHHQHTPQGARPGSLILASMLHSFVDGAAVAVAFLASPRIGWLTALAISLHEIPHRMGDFALLVHLKVPLPRALRLTLYAGLPSFLGVAAVLLAGAHSVATIAWLLPISAGSFLYIATVNLLPELEREKRLSRVLLQIACLCVGAGLVMAVGGLGG
ncbi:zinc and cadmium transporter [Granulicella pectinivorans]|uniref:Zinc and cadmium transporter n=1 Tax=Granulicella pectinivorans TaxID=474950 RepID=A0A1I6MXR9_9BACT|nr:zinc and cadmium transporter [Granulicella pectinivorans]